MKSLSRKLSKIKSKIQQKEWNKAQKFYTKKYKIALEGIKLDFARELKDSLDLQEQKNLRILKQKAKEINDFKKRLLVIEKEHQQYMKLKERLEFVKNKLIFTSDQLFSTMGKLKGCFDEIELVDFKHKQIKKEKII